MVVVGVFFWCVFLTKPQLVFLKDYNLNFYYIQSCKAKLQNSVSTISVEIKLL